jgi:16S rRNA (uracil1498-N3)-methyltransferase
VTAAHFFVEEVGGAAVRISGPDAHHAARALRIRPGEEITVSDGCGNVVRARVTSSSSSSLTGDVIARASVEQPSPRVIVFPAVPKAGKLDAVVQKLTEIGVDEIRPWFAARSVVRWDGAKAPAHAERLRAIAREAAMQSRRAWLPVVTDPGPLDNVPATAVVLDESAGVRLSAILPAVAPKEIGVVVGPEGGMAPDEVERLAGIGAHVASLGDQILRTETAAVVGPALVLARYERLG